MSWQTRVCGENLYHHVYAWGNDRHPVFKEENHYKKYLQLLKKYAKEFNVDILAYALMEWHVHLFIYDQTNTISMFMQFLHGEYAQYYNRETHRVGHVFGERFRNKVVQANEYGAWLSRYIHRQALEAHLVDDPKDYPWTSYRIYLGLERNDFLKFEIIMKQFGEGKGATKNYEQFVLDSDNGPVNWSDKKITIGFADKILMHAMKKFGIPERILLTPTGRSERRARQHIIYALHREHGYTMQEIARAFKMSHTAIARILENFEKQ